MNLNSSSAITSNNQQNGTNPTLDWNHLRPPEKAIVIAVVYEGSPEQARRSLGMSHSTFYRNWAKLKGYYNQLLEEFPKVASQILISQSIKAAQVLGDQLNSDNERVRHLAAVEILDRALDKNNSAENRIRKPTSIEEFINGEEVGNETPSTITPTNGYKTDSLNEVDKQEAINGEAQDASALENRQEEQQQEPVVYDKSWRQLIDWPKYNSIKMIDYKKTEFVEAIKNLLEWEKHHVASPDFIQVKDTMIKEAFRCDYDLDLTVL